MSMPTSAFQVMDHDPTLLISFGWGEGRERSISALKLAKSSTTKTRETIDI
jgi:hypothetical protein